MKKASIAASMLLASLEILPLAQVPVMASAKPIILVSQAVQKPLPPNSTTKSPTPALSFGLADGTPVKVKFKQAISSKTAKENDPVEFEVSEDVLVGNSVVISKGAIAKGIVTKAKRSGMLGRKGKLEISLKEVTLVSGERVSLRAEQKGGGGTSGGIIALAVVITPLALLFKGKNRTYEAGYEVLAFVDGNFKLEPDKFKPRFR
ncbi:MAG: hypothetical protein DSM106950_26710 [Stigonema ocellatum SAG 48.90 = DSM 106950]|nr:hypothetical protein [Stigonema ocellatum SAG 48.90 = DSM 106950]